MPYIITNLKTDYRVVGHSKNVYKPGDIVTYTSNTGLEIGRVKTVSDGDFIKVNILRHSTKEDLVLFEKSRDEDQRCRELLSKEIKKLNLEMKVLYVVFSIDLKYLLILYEAPRKVDFRTLLKTLLQHFKTRIEFRQILSKDLAKLLGGIGICGRVLCCKQIGRIENSCTKMAKNQNLPPSQNINGMCGKPMCCLAYEDNFYTAQREKLPKNNNYILIDSTKYLVLNINPLSELATLEDIEGVKSNIDLKTVKYKIIK